VFAVGGATGYIVGLHSMVADTRTLCELLHAELYTAELYKMLEEVMCTQGELLQVKLYYIVELVYSKL
jgi:hypothetical protein